MPSRFIVHPVDEIAGVTLVHVNRTSRHEFMAEFFIVFKDGKKTGPFALNQREGKRTTTTSSGEETTLRDMVYGKSRAIQWLDRLFYLVDKKEQYSRTIC